MIRAIVAVDKEWGIGAKNGLLFSLPLDMARFREITLGTTVVMGARTLASLPGGNPLKNRQNIVLSQGDKRNDCIVVATKYELKEALERVEDDVYVIGGAMMYALMLPFCEEVLVTKVQAVGGAEVFFPNLDTMDNWKCVEKGDLLIDGDFATTYCTYKNDAPLPLDGLER